MAVQQETDQKRILFVANVAKEHINKFHIPTIKAFKKHGWVVDVACSGDETVPECDHRFHTCWKRSPFTFRTIKGVYELRRIIDTGSYDVIYCHTPVGGLIGRLAAKKARKNGTKVIYCAHGLHFFNGAPLINWLLYYPLEKWLAHYSDEVFLVNKEDYNRARSKFTKKTRCRLVPEVGVNFDRLRVNDIAEVRKKYRSELGISDTTTALIYVAELLPNKNQTMLVDALELLVHKGEDVCLVLPGPDHDEGALANYIKQKGLEEKVRLPGWRNDVGELLYSADICTASSIREGFGINIVEAMYCGLPVIATNNRGHEMIINDGKNGYLVELNDVKTLADRVSELIHNQAIRKKFSKNDVTKYECNRIAEELFTIISKDS